MELKTRRLPDGTEVIEYFFPDVGDVVYFEEDGTPMKVIEILDDETVIVEDVHGEWEVPVERLLPSPPVRNASVARNRRLRR